MDVGISWSLNSWLPEVPPFSLSVPWALSLSPSLLLPTAISFQQLISPALHLSLYLSLLLHPFRSVLQFLLLKISHANFISNTLSKNTKKRNICAHTHAHAPVTQARLHMHTHTHACGKNTFIGFPSHPHRLSEPAFFFRVPRWRIRRHNRLPLLLSSSSRVR